MKEYTDVEQQILIEQYYNAIGCPREMTPLRIYNILSYCKEIRDTAYPVSGIKTTKLDIVQFTARCNDNVIAINGSLSLHDDIPNGPSENRTFEAYISFLESSNAFNLYIDIERLGVVDNKKIHTDEVIIEGDELVEVMTTYVGVNVPPESSISVELNRVDLKSKSNEEIKAKIMRK